MTKQNRTVIDRAEITTIRNNLFNYVKHMVNAYNPTGDKEENDLPVKYYGYLMTEIIKSVRDLYRTESFEEAKELEKTIYDVFKVCSYRACYFICNDTLMYINSL